MEFNELYLNKTLDELKDDDFLYLLRLIDFEDRINVINPSKLMGPCFSEESKYTVKEWICCRLQAVEMEIDEAYRYYGPYLSADLMEVFEKIKSSLMHNTMGRNLLAIPKVRNMFRNTSKDDFLQPYYKLYRKLDRCKEEYS